MCFTLMRNTKEGKKYAYVFYRNRIDLFVKLLITFIKFITFVSRKKEKKMAENDFTSEKKAD